MTPCEIVTAHHDMTSALQSSHDLPNGITWLDITYVSYLPHSELFGALETLFEVVSK